VDDTTRTLADGRVLDLSSTDIADRLEIRADIRRGISGRRSVQEDRPDRLAALLDEAAAEIRRLRAASVAHHVITDVSVIRRTESCERTTYYVRLTTDEGFTIEPNSHRTGHAYVENGVRIEVPGLSVEEARARIFYDAGDWADLLGIPVSPYEEDGEPHGPTMRPRQRFAMQRRMAERKRAMSQQAD
jgi:hypothetical protein